MTLLRIPFATIALFWALPSVGASDTLTSPQGPVILTVSGAISVTNDGDRAVFDRDMLAGLGAKTIETTTIWTEGVQSFTGVPLAVLMDAVGASGAAIEARAINDYAVEIPASDWQGEPGPIVAYENNGRAMSVRSKGPLWIVYPYDADARFRTEVIYSRSIWQLDRIDLVD